MRWLSKKVQCKKPKIGVFAQKKKRKWEFEYSLQNEYGLASLNDSCGHKNHEVSV
ncbi:hypothetical protein CM318V1_40026 [Carnobacterium maltaromaticum]|nr:hypothetical protein CMA01_13410 [Carnobacterium maltaromaticum]CRH19073.1 hypothetical protein CM318V1_40026 [Carnobacterium maltaromaticum]